MVEAKALVAQHAQVFEVEAGVPEVWDAAVGVLVAWVAAAGVPEVWDAAVVDLFVFLLIGSCLLPFTRDVKPINRKFFQYFLVALFK